MAGSFTKLQIDDKQLKMYLVAVTKAEKGALKKAYRSAIRPIITETKRNIRASRYKIGKRATKQFDNLLFGVRGGAWRNLQGASVYIRTPSDDFYKLLFYEGGTITRFVKRRKRYKLKKEASRGAIDSGWFFKKALAKYERTISERFDRALFKAIKGVERK